MIGRTASNAIKIKTDGGGLRAVNCACCNPCEQVYPLEQVNILTPEQYSDILNSTALSYDLQMTHDGITKGDSGNTNLLSGCNKFFEPYPDLPPPPIYIYLFARLGIFESQRNLNLQCLFFAEYEGIGGITIAIVTGDYAPVLPVGICEIKIKGVTAFSLVWDNLSGYDVAASGFFDFQ